MRILADENMPCVEALFSPHATIERMNGRLISADHLVGVDVLLIRSITKVDSQLLSKADRLRFIGSATIGTDHVDQPLLNKKSIGFASAAGCNATSVGEFVFMALLHLAEKDNIQLTSKKVGIVGAGNTGSALGRCLQAWGVQFYFCDPLIPQQENFVDQQTLLQTCDVLSFHVPLTRGGSYPTFHLMNAELLSQLPKGVWLVNASRGEVFDNQALLAWKKQHNNARFVLDVWEGEPEPLQELVKHTDLATPHIAGYSQEGKVRGTWMLYQAFLNFFGFNNIQDELSLIEPKIIQSLEIKECISQKKLSEICLYAFDLTQQDGKFRQAIQAAGGFDELRKNHGHHREFRSIAVTCSDSQSLSRLLSIGFSKK